MMPSVVIACSSCGASNRIPAERLASAAAHSSHPRCGKCKTPLPPPGEPIEVDESAFDAIVSSSKLPVLVDFWAAWCGPCRMAAPEVHQLAREMAGKALVLKVDTDAQPQLAGRYQIQSIPNFVVFAGGKPVFQRAGTAPRAEMRRWVEKAAAES